MDRGPGVYDIVHYQCVSACLLLVIDQPTHYSLLNEPYSGYVGRAVPHHLRDVLVGQNEL